MCFLQWGPLSSLNTSVNKQCIIFVPACFSSQPDWHALYEAWTWLWIVFTGTHFNKAARFNKHTRIHTHTHTHTHTHIYSSSLEWVLYGIAGEHALWCDGFCSLHIKENTWCSSLAPAENYRVNHSLDVQTEVRVCVSVCMCVCAELLYVAFWSRETSLILLEYLKLVSKLVFVYLNDKGEF